MSWADQVSRALPDTDVAPESDVRVRVGVPVERWRQTATAARDELGCDYFDLLTAAEEPTGGYRVVCHLARVGDGPVHSVLLQTSLPAESPHLRSLSGLFAGAAWHEREMHEMYGVVFDEGDARPLLLTGPAEVPPLRKEILLPARSARPWPGAKEPGESDADASPSRRRLRPPGVPEEPRR